MKTITVSAPGKTILSGEHSVVYGYPALVVAINKRIQLSCVVKEQPDTKGKYQEFLAHWEQQSMLELLAFLQNTKLSGISKFSLESAIPIGCGLGSSAALAVCLSAITLLLAGESTSKEKINELAFKLEKQTHQNPSGVDNTIVTLGGALQYRKVNGVPEIKSLSLRKDLCNFLLINTGKPIESTGEMVLKVKEKRTKYLTSIESILLAMGKVTELWIDYFIGEPTLPIFELISRNERYLEELGVVSVSTQRIISQIEGIGGTAKISGAGGVKGHSGMLLAYHEESTELEKLARDMKWEFFPIERDDLGVVMKIEKKVLL